MFGIVERWYSHMEASVVDRHTQLQPNSQQSSKYISAFRQVCFTEACVIRQDSTFTVGIPTVKVESPTVKVESYLKQSTMTSPGIPDAEKGSTIGRQLGL